MKTLAKLAMGAAMLTGVAMSAAPADAAVVVRVGPGYHHSWCWRHPAACHRDVVVVGGPRIGVFYGGRGWWDGHRYWAHRERWHGGWRYR